MASDLPPVDSALDDVRNLFADAGEPFKIVGGVAVVHHGYARTTEDVDVLVERGAPDRLEATLPAHGFERMSELRLRHIGTGVRLDLLVAGTQLPRAGGGTYPSPRTLAGSARDSDVVDLPGLLDLKLRARRHRDMADVVELLKRLDDMQYSEAEASVDRTLRAELAALRQDALGEMADER